MSGQKDDKSQLTDEALMQAYALRADYSAFEELYKRHSRLVYGFLQKKLREKETIDDVFQATWLKLHRFRSKYDSSLPFLPWLFTLCRNVMLDSLRAKARVREETRAEIETLSGQAANEITDPATDSLAMLRIHEWSAELSPAQREVISLRFGEDLSFDEIAARLRIKSSGARKLSQRAIQKLRTLFK